VSQASNAFRAQEWAHVPREANLRFVRVSASSFFAGFFLLIFFLFYGPWNPWCTATWHNALAMLGLGFAGVWCRGPKVIGSTQ